MKFDKVNDVKDKRPAMCDFDEFMRKIREDGVKHHIIAYRHGNAEAKKRLPGFCFQASYDGKARKDSNAVPSGLVMTDFDHLDDAELAEIKDAVVRMTQEEDSVVRIAHVTPSGKGLRVVIKATKQGVFAGCRSILDYQLAFARLLGYEDKLDKGTHDLARISFCPMEEDLFYLDDKLFDEEPEVTFFGGSSAVQKQRMEAKCRQPLNFAGEPEQTHYCGIALKDIFLRYFEYGDGLPEEGSRNQKLFSAACDLRQICDFHPSTLYHALPDVGLPPEEVMALCTSACEQPRGKHLSRRLRKVLSSFEEEKAEEQAEADDFAGQRPEPVYPGYIFKPLLSLLPPDFREAGLLALLPILGTLASRVRGRYVDGELHSPSFITTITAEQASGKSFARYFVQLLLEPIAKQDAAYREMERIYARERRKAKTVKDEPDEPETCIRIVPPNISVAKLLYRLYKAKGLHLFTFAEELDTFTKSNSAGVWSDKSDIYRVSFDNSQYGRDFVCDDSSTMVNVYYNLLSLGTPLQRQRFFGDVEDGLVSRTCFARLPDQFGAKFVSFGKLTPSAERSVMACVQRLMAFGGEVDMHFLFPAVEEWLEEQRKLAVLEGCRARDTLRRRASVIAFRAVMMVVPLYKLRSGGSTDCLIDFYKSLADLVLREQLNFAGDKLNQLLERDAELQLRTQRRQPLLFGQLPEIFGKSDLDAILQKTQMRTPARQFIYNWLRHGFVKKQGGLYKKC